MVFVTGILRNNFSGNPSTGTSNRSKSVASQANATLRPSGETAGELSLPRGYRQRVGELGLGDELAGVVSFVSTTHK